MVPKPQKPKIACAQEVQDRLAKHGSKGDTFEKIITKLLDFFESRKK